MINVPPVIPSGILHGRHVIRTDTAEITPENILSVLQKALETHWINRSEIVYLWNYYCGVQPILYRVKDVRPEICNTIVENRANEIVSFKTGYLMGEPLQYVSRGDGENIGKAIDQLNEFVFAEEKASKDKELADWFHICGTAFRMILPDASGDEDDCPFEIYTLNPMNAFVVYHNGLDEKPVLGVKYVTDEDGTVHYSCYTRDMYFEVENGKTLVSAAPHVLGEIPIVEYPLNLARMGAFEVVISLLDAINLTDSNRLDGVEQFIQALLLFHNVAIDEEKVKVLRDLGAIQFTDVDQSMKGEIEYLVNNLDQASTQQLVDHMYETVLTICGMPNRNGGSSTSDTGTAVIMRDGWSAAEARAKDTELMFKKSERLFLKIALHICDVLRNLSLKVHNVEIRFTRRNYENIMQKAQVLDLLLKNGKVHPRLAFEHSGLFTDADLAYSISAEYAEQQEQKMQEMLAKQQSPDNPDEDTAQDEKAAGDSS